MPSPSTPPDRSIPDIQRPVPAVVPAQPHRTLDQLQTPGDLGKVLVEADLERFAVTVDSKTNFLRVEPLYNRVDKESFATIEVQSVLDEIGRVGNAELSEHRTKYQRHSLYSDAPTVSLGQSMLHARLTDTEQDPRIVRARQDAFKELSDDPQLRRGIESAVGAFNEFYDRIVIRPSSWRDAYMYRKIREAFGVFEQRVANIPDPQSPYLRGLVESIRSFSTTESAELIRGPLCSLNGKLVPKSALPVSSSRDEVGIHRPHVPFGPVTLTLTAVFGTCFITHVQKIASFIASDVTAGVPAGVLLLATLFVPLIGGGFKSHDDSTRYTGPFLKHLESSDNVKKLILATSTLEEMMMMQRWLGDTSQIYHREFPVIRDEADRMTLRAKEIRHPLWCSQGKEIVPNDVTIGDGARLVVVTGPNSAGKTAFIKTATLLTMFGAAGYPVFGREVEMSLPDRHIFIAPERNSANDREGQFGMELMGLREAWMKMTARTFAALDEILNGTDNQGRHATLERVLRAFRGTGAAILLPTHNLELAQELVDQRLALAIQGEMNGDVATHRFILGVAPSSRSDLVIDRVAFPPTEENVARFFTTYKKPLFPDESSDSAAQR